MKKYNSIWSVLFLITVLFAGNSCTDLSETVYHDMVTDNFYQNRAEVMSAVTRPYTHMRAWHTPYHHSGYYGTCEFAADQLAWPQKGRHGYDEAKWIRLHSHTWNLREPGFEQTWDWIYTGIGFCSDAMENLEKRSAESMGITEAERDAFIGELQILRAYHYMKLMDMFGNIPVVTKVGEPISPPTEARVDVFKFIEEQILERVEDLDVLRPETIGRVARAAGYAILADLYLNAEKWAGTPRWDDCIKYCDKILSGEAGSQHGILDFDEDLMKPFSNINGETSNENIFSISYDYTSTDRYCSWQGLMYHFSQRYIYGGTADGNNGVVVIPSAYDQFHDKDLRKQKWMLIGPQWYYDDPERPVLGTEEYEGQQLVFVNYIRRESERVSADQELPSTMIHGEENSGARFNKYNPGPSSDRSTYWNNDWVIYRLTDIHFIKAEALMRKNNGIANQDAVDLINARVQMCYEPEDVNEYLYTTSTLTLDALLAERGREFIFEGKRRTDLIRFGKFLTESWWDHTPSIDPNLEIFPIPYKPLTANPNLKQNPGYPRE
ncbi:MAG: RagB/SusD family nutrient uptake outer membrane protein [Tannerellaceae bacterium]|nr:RagB/SusD family nutrient uptake outer membrane protein [Tannerellaceae bacterium]